MDSGTESFQIVSGSRIKDRKRAQRAINRKNVTQKLMGKEEEEEKKADIWLGREI